MGDKNLKFVVLSIECLGCEPMFHINEYTKITAYDKGYYVEELNQYIDKNDINKSFPDLDNEYCFFCYLLNPSKETITDYKVTLKHDLLYKLKFQKNYLEKMIEQLQKFEEV